MLIRDFAKMQKRFSLETFGPHDNRVGVIDHIRKEIDEVEENPNDLMEWMDIAILAFEGALRSGYSPREIEEGIIYKHRVNEEREWPDWRDSDPNVATEHLR